MGLFKSKYQRELDMVIEKIEMNMSNNYKDAAQENLKLLMEKTELFCKEGKLNEKQKEYYESQIGVFQERLKGFTHKDQKPYWT